MSVLPRRHYSRVLASPKRRRSRIKSLIGVLNSAKRYSRIFPAEIYRSRTVQSLSVFYLKNAEIELPIPNPFLSVSKRRMDFTSGVSYVCKTSCFAAVKSFVENIGVMRTSALHKSVFFRKFTFFLIDIPPKMWYNNSTSPERLFFRLYPDRGR